jgi:hypothetical protein
MSRILQPELLDILPPTDPRAVQSRRDLQRLNKTMRHAALMAEMLRPLFEKRVRLRLMELGAGDGTFLLSLANALGPRPWAAPVEATLVDQVHLVDVATEDALNALNWKVRSVRSDIFEFLGQSEAVVDVTIANLFIHHFEDARLRELFRALSERTRLFIALEPRRAFFPMLCSRMVGLIGCNAVTQHDARISVQAGFAGQELAQLWPKGRTWRLGERSAGLFSHQFVADGSTT